MSVIPSWDIVGDSLPEDRDFLDDFYTPTRTSEPEPEPEPEPEGLDDDSLARLGINNVPVYEREPHQIPLGDGEPMTADETLTINHLDDIRLRLDAMTQNPNLDVNGNVNVAGDMFSYGSVTHHGSVNHHGHTMMSAVSAGDIVTTDIVATNIHATNIILAGDDLLTTVNDHTIDIRAQNNTITYLEDRIRVLEDTVVELLDKLREIDEY